MQVRFGRRYLLSTAEDISSKRCVTNQPESLANTRVLRPRSGDGEQPGATVAAQFGTLFGRIRYHRAL